MIHFKSVPCTPSRTFTIWRYLWGFSPRRSRIDGNDTRPTAVIIKLSSDDIESNKDLLRDWTSHNTSDNQRMTTQVSDSLNFDGTANFTLNAEQFRPNSLATLRTPSFRVSTRAFFKNCINLNVLPCVLNGKQWDIKNTIIADQKCDQYATWTERDE